MCSLLNLERDIRANYEGSEWTLIEQYVNQTCVFYISCLISSTSHTGLPDIFFSLDYLLALSNFLRSPRLQALTATEFLTSQHKHTTP